MRRRFKRASDAEAFITAIGKARDRPVLLIWFLAGSNERLEF